MATLRTRIGDRPVIIDVFEDEYVGSFDLTRAERAEQMHDESPWFLPVEFRAHLIAKNLFTVLAVADGIVAEFENDVKNWS